MFHGFGGTTAAFYGAKVSPKYWKKIVLLILFNSQNGKDKDSQKIQNKMQHQQAVSKI